MNGQEMTSGNDMLNSPTVPEPRLIAHVISERAKSASTYVWASIPVSPTDASLGYEDITYARLNYSISRAVRWLYDTLGPERPVVPKPLAYLGPPDTRYVIFTVAAIKTGYQVCLQWFVPTVRFGNRY